MPTPAAPEDDAFTPLTAARSGGQRAAVIVAAVVAALAAGFALGQPQVIMAAPAVLILILALLSSGRLGGREEAAVVIDENGVFDARCMDATIPWRDIRQVIEVRHVGRLGDTLGYSFIIDADQPERFARHKSLRSAFPTMVVTPRGLIPGAGPFRRVFRQARAAGLLRTLVV